MEIVMCGTLVPEEYELIIKDLSNAANRFVSNVVSCFRNEGHHVRVVSYIGINTSSEVKKSLRNDDSADFVFKTKLRFGGIRRVLAILKGYVDVTDWFVAYNPVYAWLVLPFMASHSHRKSALILADFSPPESYTNLGRKIYAYLQLMSIRKYDIVIGLSENVERFMKKGQKFLCVEGGINKEVYEFFNKYTNHDGEKMICMYAGILEHVTGVEMLIDAIDLVDDDSIELWISGKGSLEETIKEKAKNDKAVKFLGYLSYNDYLEQLKNADILINPRNMNLPENMNNFPSKILEYIATGKRVISTKYPGWERFGTSVYFCESTAESISKAIIDLKKQKEKEDNWRDRRKMAKDYLWENRMATIIKEMRG